VVSATSCMTLTNTLILQRYQYDQNIKTTAFVTY